MGSLQSGLPPSPTDTDALYWHWTTDRQTKLFVSETPPHLGGENTIAVVFWFHGLHTHSQQEENKGIINSLSKEGYHTFCYDHAGHGRSATDKERGWIGNWRWWIDDAINFILHIMSQDKYSDLPFFISGVSLGGAIALKTGLQIQQLQQEDAPNLVWVNWAGIVVVSPSIGRNSKPSWMEMQVLETAYVLRGDSLALGPAPDPDHYPNEELYLKTVNDPFVYSGRMKLGLSWEAREMINELHNEFKEIAFPFLVFHGTDDDIVPFSVSEKLYSESLTPPEDKTLISVEGARHFLFSDPNVQHVNILKGISEWMKSRLEKWADVASL